MRISSVEDGMALTRSSRGVSESERRFDLRVRQSKPAPPGPPPLMAQGQSSRTNTFLGAAPGAPLGADAFFPPAPFQRPYSCPSCPYRANQKSDLKRHLLVHTGERPFACPHCPYRVNYRYDLAKHIRRRHAPAPLS
ncbi:zinc finger protein 513-like [Penaeus japonicus]|uniref:zinc finger protein 513-like n=1 Tax=Penaeus japonicus TaxID=27405 RepID=UPI001C70E25F|nr:zinc finger protein 513-like [Penaeus japonicus]